MKQPRSGKPARSAFTFKRGWNDYLERKPYPKEYWDMHIAPLQYERGRHAAALYTHDCRRQGLSINNVPYAQARKQMTPEVRRMIDEERRWCALRGPKLMRIT